MATETQQAFSRGLMAGLASPYTIYAPPLRSSYRNAPELLAAAWRRVGASLQTALDMEGAGRDQPPRETARAD